MIGSTIAFLVVPLVLYAIARYAGGHSLPLAAHVLLTLALVVPLGPILYRIAYQPVAEASVLVLLACSSSSGAGSSEGTVDGTAAANATSVAACGAR